ncbi:MAG TPA: hypothetical protein VFM77_15690, partial [Terriglobales bacterium]|nr:hypothetical protein [Terriglobales bacterium]
MNRKLSCLALLCSISAAAQTTSKLAGNPPDAPSKVSFDLRLSNLEALPQAATPQAGSPQGQAAPGNTTAGSQTAGTTPRNLSIKDAEQLAIQNNPQTTVARLNALPSQQVTRETRSALFPQANMDLTGVDSHPGSRITAGGLNNPIIYERAAAGASVTQLIT